MNDLLNDYEIKFVEFQSMKTENQRLNDELSAILNKMSKPKVISVIEKRISDTDNDGRKLEKDFQRGQMNLKQFIGDYMDKRKEFHKYQIHKIKVNQA